MGNWEDYKGLRWYAAAAVIMLSLYAYSQSRGLLWLGSTSTTVPAKDGTGPHGVRPGYRYYHHK